MVIRRSAKTDRNHAEIRDAMRKCGAWVIDMSAAGRGIPDLLVVHRMRNFWVEVKDGEKPPSARRLTPDQVKFHEQAKASGMDVYVVTTIDEALALMNDTKAG
jgi:hypothetical protein